MKERSIDYSKCEYLPDKKKYSGSNENILFLRKTDETIWKPPFLREPPPPPPPPPLQLTPLFLSNFILRGGGNYVTAT